MRNTKKAFLEVIAKVGEKSAKLGANSASMLGFHQAKEPEALKNVKKK